jgi:hypothetical protein
MNGNAQITDFPACSARPDGYLLPEDSVVAPDVGRQTVSSGRSLSQSRAAPTDLTITRVDLRPTNAEPVPHVRLDVCGLARYVRKIRPRGRALFDTTSTGGTRCH